MSFPPEGDMNVYNGFTLELIARTVVNLEVDYRVTKIYGSKDRPCSVDVKDTLKSVTFPQGSKLTQICPYAFYECQEIKKLDLRPCTELVSIDIYAFFNCSSLKEVFLPKEKLETIADYSFQETGIMNLFIPKKVSEVGFSALKNCRSMRTLEFEAGSLVTTLNKYLLTNSLVETFLVRKGVTLIKSGVFEAARSLTSIQVEEGNTKYKSVSNGLMDSEDRYICFPLGLKGEYTLPSNTKVIFTLAFYESNVTKVTLPRGVTEVGEYAFASSHSLREIVFSDTVWFFGIFALGDCISLTELNLPDSVESISERAFEGCTFSRVVIPEGARIIQTRAFNKNPNLMYVSIPSTITNFGGNVFPDNEGIFIEFAGGCPLELVEESKMIMDKDKDFISQYLGKHVNYSPSIPASVKVIKSGAFFNKTNLVGITFQTGSQLTTIEEDAFYGCSNLATITFPSNLAVIGKNAFCGCLGFTEVVLGSVFATLGSGAFTSCKNIASVNLQHSIVKTIGSGAFENCTKLTIVSLPPNEIGFEANCFLNCYLLSTLTFQSGSKVTKIGDYSFSSTSLATFSFPQSSTVNEICRYAFSNCTKFSSIIFVDSIKIIGVAAFSFTALTSVTLVTSIDKVGDKCFASCPLFKSFIIPSGSLLTEEGLGLRIFANSTSFKEIKCESTNFKVANGALYTPDQSKILIFPCASPMECFPIPESVRTIGYAAFYDCINLLSIIISKDATHTIGISAFEGCRKLHYINIPKSVKYIGDSAFLGCNSLYCGVDIESKDPYFLDTLLYTGKLPRKAFQECNKITCQNIYPRGFNIFFAMSIFFIV